MLSLSPTINNTTANDHNQEDCNITNTEYRTIDDVENFEALSNLEDNEKDNKSNVNNSDEHSPDDGVYWFEFNVVVDSSSKPILGERPFEFLAGVSQVIKGWDLSIMDMKEGEARKLVINSDLGYGDKGAGGKIPGKATLYFAVELAEIGAMSKLGEEQHNWLEEHPL